MAKTTTTAGRRLIYTALDELQPADRNPKRHDLPAIGRSIETFGYVIGGGSAARRGEGWPRRALADPDLARVVVRG